MADFFATIKKVIGVAIKKSGSSFQATVRGNQTVALTADRTLDLPAQDASSTLVSIDSTDTLTNKTMSGASNTFTNLSLTSAVTGILPVANGGTNSNTALSNNRVIQSSGGKIVEATAITASRALASDTNGIPVAAATTATELGYVNGVTSALQTQLDAKMCATSVTNVSSNVTLTNKSLHFVDTSSARSLTLPSPTTGSYIVIKDSIGSCATNNITVVRAASEKIETVAASYVLDTDLGGWVFVSNGTDWFII